PPRAATARGRCTLQPDRSPDHLLPAAHEDTVTVPGQGRLDKLAFQFGRRVIIFECADGDVGVGEPWAVDGDEPEPFDRFPIVAPSKKRGGDGAAIANRADHLFSMRSCCQSGGETSRSPGGCSSPALAYRYAAREEQTTWPG